MKKLLSLLSVLTISGTAVPTTIAASPYQKEETIKNSEINYSQTNNNLKRSKRGFDACGNYTINISTLFPNKYLNIYRPKGGPASNGPDPSAVLNALNSGVNSDVQRQNLRSQVWPYLQVQAGPNSALISVSGGSCFTGSFHVYY